jgi:CRP-like cAMP-binding protein
MEFAFPDHLGCSVLLESMRGTVCAALFTGSPRAVRRGERVFDAGDASDALFQVRSGLIKLTSVTAAGDEMLLEVYYPEAVFGEMCFCEEPHTATATAIEDSEIVTATLGRLRNLFREQPDLAFALFGEFASRLSAAYTNLQTAVFDVVLTRVAVRLTELAARGSRTANGSTDLPYRLPHSELADMLGVRRETVTRAMVELRRLNLVAYLPDGRLRLDNQKLKDYIEHTARTR